MPLQTQYVPVELGGQLDEKTDQRLVIPGNFINLENTVYTKTGSLRKRPGNDLLSRTVFGASNLPAARSLVGYGDSLLMFGNDTMYALASGETTWYNKGQIPEPTISRQIAVSTKPNVSASTPAQGVHWLTCAKANGMTLYLAENAGGTAILGTLVDDDGTVLFANVSVNTTVNCTNPRIAAVGNNLIALYSDATSIYARVFDTASPTGFGAESAIVSGKYAGGFWDACGLTDRFAIVYKLTSLGVIYIATTTFDGTLAQLATVSSNQNATPNIEVAAIAGSNLANSIWIVWITDNGVNWYCRCRQYDLALGIVTGTTQIETAGFGAVATYRARIGIVLTPSGGGMQVVCNTPADGTSDSVVVNDVAGSGGGGGTGTVGSNQVMHSLLSLVSKPFAIGTQYYVALRDSNENTFYMANLGVDDFAAQKLIPVATYAVGAASGNADTLGAPFRRALLSDVVSLSSTSVLIPGLTNLGNLVNISGYTASFDTGFTFAECNEALCVSGGLPGSYAGNKFVEYGFLQRPIVSAAVSGTPGTFAAGSYRYQVIYEWVDENGLVFRSQPSDLVVATVTAGTSDKITLTISYIAFTRKQRNDTAIDSVQVKVYREYPVNSGVYRLLGQFDNSVDYLNTFTASSPFTDTSGTTNATLAASTDILYTASFQPNLHPPSAKYVLSHNGRVWLAGLDSPTQIWASFVTPLGQAPAFPAGNTITIPDGGAVTGLASMDNKLIVFKKDRVFIVVGQGPNDLGTANDWQVHRVATYTGCVDGRSIVTTDEGVFYQSSTGIYLLSRSLESSYIGAPVENTVNTYATVSSAIKHAHNSWVLFSVGPSGSNGVILLYDLYHRKWSKWLLNDTVGAQTSAFAKSMTMLGDKFVWITSAGVPYRESTQFLDNGTYVSMTVESAWLKFAGLVGFQRVRNLLLLGESKSAHNLTISIGNNYDASTYGQSATFAYSVLAWPSEQFGLKLSQQKTSAMRFKLVDTQHVDGLGTGEGCVLSGIGFEVGAKSPLFGNLPIGQGG